MEKSRDNEDNSRKGIVEDEGWRCAQRLIARTWTTHATIWLLNSTSKDHKGLALDLSAHWSNLKEQLTRKECQKDKVKSEENLSKIPI